MQVASRRLVMTLGRARPFGVPGRFERRSAGRGRNSVADSPQDFGGGLRPAVRSVQHLNPLFDDQTFAQALSVVTRTDQRNILTT